MKLCKNGHKNKSNAKKCQKCGTSVFIKYIVTGEGDDGTSNGGTDGGGTLTLPPLVKTSLAQDRSFLLSNIALVELQQIPNVALYNKKLRVLRKKSNARLILKKHRNGRANKGTRRKI